MKWWQLLLQREWDLHLLNSCLTIGNLWRSWASDSERNISVEIARTIERKLLFFLIVVRDSWVKLVDLKQTEGGWSMWRSSNSSSSIKWMKNKLTIWDHSTPSISWVLLLLLLMVLLGFLWALWTRCVCCFSSLLLVSELFCDFCMWWSSLSFAHDLWDKGSSSCV